MKSLNIVAHPDDDLLFLNPDILEDIENGDGSSILYMTRGDDGRNRQYYDRRFEAVSIAYPDYIHPYYYGIKSNSFRNGDVYGSLYAMWNDHTLKVEPVGGDKFPVPFYTYDVVVELIRQSIEYSKPDVIRTHDPDVEPSIDHDEPHLDHIDHIYTAKFVQEAAKAFPHIPVYAYMGYPIRYQPENVVPELAAKKLQMWRKYQEIDTEVAGEQWDIAMSRQYKRRIQ